MCLLDVLERGTTRSRDEINGKWKNMKRRCSYRYVEQQEKSSIDHTNDKNMSVLPNHRLHAQHTQST
jgi:hypothetical protein